jgi:SpoVK/Ycf46/Vps4 family AAA+-type ATPase
MNDRIPTWLDELMVKFKAGIGHLFILWGNIYDLQKNMRGEYRSLYQYLADIFEQRDLVMFYSLSAGLQFANEDMEKLFRSHFLGANFSSPGGASAGQSATQAAAAKLQQSQASSAPLSQLIGDSPIQVLKFLERALTDNSEESPRCSLIIDFAHNVAPNQTGGNNAGDRINAEILERWAKNDLIKSAGNTVVLLSPSLASMTEGLRSSQSETVAIRIPKPNEEQRTSRWAHNITQNGVKFADGLTAEFLGRITNGLSLRQLDSIYLLAREEKIPVTLSLIKEKKQEIFETEFGDRIKVMVPRWGFDLFGGKDYLKQYMLEIRDNIVNGVWRRAPMGILASGPPGTGKTFFFECWAFECGFNFLEIVNPRSKWVGDSEEIAEKIFSAIDDLSPVIVVEDEADQSETGRDTPNGDSGVSNRLRQMKFKFTSDPKRRGRVIWVRISNRADLLDEAYKREGRSDDTVPFLMPESSEYEDIFKVMFARYGIPSDIIDFSLFAQEVAAKVYCTGASVEWMVREADMYSGREGKDKVETVHLQQAVSDWEMKLNPKEVDRQIILAIEGSSKRLRPTGWEMTLSEAKDRLYGRQPPPTKEASVFPGLGKAPIKQ